MINFLNSLTPFNQGLFLVLSFFVALGFIVLVYKYGIKLNSKFVNISVDNDDQPQVKKSPHAGCKHAPDAYNAIRELFANCGEKHRLKDLNAVRIQMDLAESAISEMVAVFTKVYVDLLDKKGEADPVSTPSFRSYRNVLKVTSEAVTAKLRTYVRENHFASKTEKEFEDYIDTRTKQVIQLMTDTFNDIYISKISQITRAELYEANQEQRPEIEHILRDFFQNCRVVAIKIQGQIEEINKRDEQIFARFSS